MCGRFVQLKRRRDYELYLQMLARREGKLEIEEKPSWNIPPSSLVWAVRHRDGELQVDRLTWGWPATAENRLVSNARMEGAAEKRLFREAWQARRCLVPVEGWYEWHALGGGRKQPYFFSLRSLEPALLAGLWMGEAFVLLTGETHGPLAAVHHRRPVAIPRAEARRWCEPREAWTQEELAHVTVPEDAFEITPVGSAVNSTRQDGPELVQPIDAAQVARADLMLPGF